jgi:L-ascorbate metabolism protein UlaG (beta-lactamase superfamily)
MLSPEAMDRRSFLLGLAALPACAPLRPVERGELARATEEGYHHVGHGAHLLVWGALGVLTDPARGRAPAAPMPTDPDVVLLTRARFDEAALARLDKQAALVVPLAALARASRLGFAEVVGASPGDDLEVRGLRVAVVEGDGGLCYRLAREGRSIFVAGASVTSEAMRAEAARRPVDLCLLPGDLESSEATLALAEAFGAGRVILTHAPAPGYPDWFHAPRPGQFIAFPWDRGQPPSRPASGPASTTGGAGEQ